MAHTVFSNGSQLRSRFSGVVVPVKDSARRIFGISVFMAALVRTAIGSTCGYSFSVETLKIGDHDVQVEHYIPSTRRYKGAVIMFHSAAGLFSLANPSDVPEHDNFGEHILAASCFEVFLPHYLDLIDRSSLMAAGDISFYAKTILDQMPLLLDSIEKGPAKRYYAFGESLGAFLAIRMGLQRKEIGAISEVSGGLEPGSSRANHLISLLIFHGEDDNVVNVQTAYDLIAYCRRYSFPVQYKIIEGKGHYFTETDRLRISTATATFFEQLDRRGSTR